MDIKRLLQNLREEVSCPVCKNPFTDPKQLQCLHSFCLVCLHELQKTGRRQDSVTCPMCKRVSNIPHGGNLNDLPTSFYLNSMLDALAIKECNISQVKCGNCDKKSSQTFYCFQCFAFWCADCINAHNAIRTNKSHRVLALKDFRDDDFKDVLKRPTFCRKLHHEKEELKFFCKNCELAVCNTCVVTLHQGHPVTPLNEAANELKMKISAMVDTQQRKTQEKFGGMIKLDEERIKIQSQVANLTRDVQRFADDLIAVVQAKKQYVIKTMEQQANDSCDRLQNRKNEIENQKRIIEKTKALLERGTAAEIVQLKKSLDSVWDQLERSERIERGSGGLPCFTFQHNEKIFQALNKEGIGSLEILVTETQAKESSAEGKGLGEATAGLKATFIVITRNTEGLIRYNELDKITITFKDERGQYCSSDVTLTDQKNGKYLITYSFKAIGQYKAHVQINGEHIRGSPFVVQVKTREFASSYFFGVRGSSDGMFDRPWGVAVKKNTNEIAVTDCNNFRVVLFDDDGTYLRGFGKKGSGDAQFIQPSGIVFDKNGNILVADSSNNQIQIFKGNGEYVGKFGVKGSRVRQLACPNGLSLSNEGNIIVADSGNKLIKIFSPRGEFLQNIGTDGSFNFPIHCVQYDENHFIVSDRDDNCLKIFNREGIFLYKFGKKGVGDGEFNIPGCLSVNKLGHLMVCDTYNHRVQVFELDGKFVTKFGTQGNRVGQFNFPISVAGLSDTRILVSEYGNHRVQVFE